MRKVNVEVIAEFSPEGDMTPLMFCGPNGRVEKVDRLISCRQSADLNICVQGQRYDCIVMGQQTALWFDNGRWFMAEI